MTKASKNPLGRRSFLRSAAAGAAALVANPKISAAPPVVEESAPTHVEVSRPGRPGSDFMVDVLKTLDLDYICSNPSSSIRGLHESIINYGGNKNPEFITCCHEESSVAMAHGYAKIEGKPIAVGAHAVVGVQHAAMAIYNAYCDRVPIYIIVGNIVDATHRGSTTEWVHSAQDVAAIVRDCVKWDDLPASLNHFSESAVRAYKIAMTPPMMPVLLVLDGDLQENPIPADASLHIPKLSLAAPPQGDSGAVREAAKMLVAAENPVILADRTARTAAGMSHLIELAELLQAPVIDQGGRMNMPTRHPLNQTERARELVGQADVIMALEVINFWSALNAFRSQVDRTSHPLTKQGVKLINLSSGDLFTKSNYQDFQRFVGVDLDIAAEAEATLPSLIEAVKTQITATRKSAFQDRGAKFAIARQQSLERARNAAAAGWDTSPISTARLSAEVWNQVKGEDWALVSESAFISNWPKRLWAFDKHYQHIGGSGGSGIGYGAPAAVGAALANKKYGRLSVNIQQDGDLMYAPGVLWTAAHHRIPLLSVMHNNRAYHQEIMEVQMMCNWRDRGIQNATIGTTLTNPDLNYAKIAQGMGLYTEGPITNPNDLAPAIRRAVEVVKRGEPALLDVHTQGR
jgi:thiamine pyrophosphate-dependent acetolactate synthase large subunit-like protein